MCHLLWEDNKKLSTNCLFPKGSDCLWERQSRADSCNAEWGRCWLELPKRTSGQAPTSTWGGWQSSEERFPRARWLQLNLQKQKRLSQVQGRGKTFQAVEIQGAKAEKGRATRDYSQRFKWLVLAGDGGVLGEEWGSQGDGSRSKPCKFWILRMSISSWSLCGIIDK